MALTSDAGVVDDYGIGLVRADHFVEPIFLPIRLPRPVPIKPKSPDGAVVLAENLNRGVKIVQILVELRLVAGVALPTPVEGGVVKEWDNTLSAASRDEFRNKIAASRRVEGVVLGEATGIVEAESLVVARGEDDVLHSRLARESGDRASIVILRRECLFQLVVLIERDFFQVLDPLTFTQLGVESPMDEHPVGEGFEVSDAWKWRWDRHGFTWSPNLEVESLRNGEQNPKTAFGEDERIEA